MTDRFLRCGRGRGAQTAALATAIGAVVAVPVLTVLDAGHSKTQPVAATHRTVTVSSAASNGSGLRPRTADPAREQLGPARPVPGRWYPYDLGLGCGGFMNSPFGTGGWVSVGKVPRITPDPQARKAGHIAGYMMLVSPQRARFTSLSPKLDLEFQRMKEFPVPCPAPPVDWSVSHARRHEDHRTGAKLGRTSPPRSETPQAQVRVVP